MFWNKTRLYFRLGTDVMTLSTNYLTGKVGELSRTCKS